MSYQTSIVNIKVEYSHTDKMGYVHHSQYLIYYEYARWEFLRNLGISYKNIEKDGVMMPVISAKLKFLKPAFYDDKLKIYTKLKVDGAKFIFRHKIYNGIMEQINTGEVKVVCVDGKSRKPVKPTGKINDLLNEIANK